MVKPTLPPLKALLLLPLMLSSCTPNDAPAPSASALSIVRLTDGRPDSVEMRGAGLMQSAADGTIFIATDARSRLVMQVDSFGHFIRTIGAVGDGPGEYRSVRFLLTKADSLLIQGGDGVFHVFGANGGYVRSFRSEVLMGPGQGAAVRGDTLILAEDLSSREAIGKPIHLLAPDGHIVKSFGEGGEGDMDGGVYLSRMRAVFPESDSSFWVARRDRYLLELWNTKGELERSLDLKRDWFPRVTENPGDPRYVRPPAVLQAIGKDPDGHLIVVVQRAASDWIMEPHTAEDLKKPRKMSTDDWSKYEWVIEIVDPVTGTLLASEVKNTSSVYGHFLANGLAVGFTRTPETGASVPAFWRITYNRPE